jgi:endonuclease/exonuclease/phosphatase family metal-dependent hydrolase
VILRLRVIDLVAGAALVGVVGGGAVSLTTDLGTATYAAPVSSTVIADPAPPTELVSADPFVLPDSRVEKRTGSAAERTGAVSRVEAPRTGGYVPHAGLASGSSSTAATASTAVSRPASSPAVPAVSTAPVQAALPADKPSKPASARTAATDVTVSSFNVLGASHTKGKGKKRGFARGKVRAGYAAQAIRERDVDLVGFQELERPQARTIVGRLPDYSIFPGPSKRRHASANSIAWRNDTWKAVETHTIEIPYFGGNLIKMPYVRLHNLATGTDVWVANFHNPASIKSRGDQSRWRAEATRRQVALANRLRADTGLPVIFTGDFNERDVYFCRLVGGTELEASNGGSVSADGHCSPPRDARIDWVFGTPELDWTSSIVDKGALIQRTTDHPMIVAEAKLRVTVGP